MPTVHLVIKGKVQGVFYRANAKKKAEALGLKGWVKNTDDGDVEAMTSGSQEAIDSFVKWCHKGPSRAKVTGVELTQKDDELFEEFVVKR